ncbi:MAG: oxidoreductase [Lentisphaerae bacterium RIFOXYB12_FULL_65_16]|nr:MAG: oxidoreductase [Lentisphaerae bacterium RIFOXYA12_64_32]OGV89043.1 MAG: oxidoreductase [Lentisphaerae bacterium RIFOXYB12_FULL_65_16]
MSDPVRVGIVGCGNISGLYIQGCQKFDILKLVACADLDMARAEAKAKELNVPRACAVEELIADPEIEIVVNLTIPAAHFPVAEKALLAGKNAYNEKPLSVTREQGAKLLKLAKARKLRVGCAPDTFLGAGLQTCRKLVDDGWIGTPVGATAFMLSRGPERGHPDPEFFYKPGGGPLFDMGPYYLTAMVNLLGPVRAVTGMTRASFSERIVTSKPKYGQRIKVETPTHIVAVLEFASGAIGNMVMSFDCWRTNLPRIEVYGSDGTLGVPDPNTFGGPVLFARAQEAFAEVPLSHAYREQFRSLGIADLAYGLRSGRAHRASGELACHVLDVMHAILDAGREGKRVKVKSTCAQPAPLPVGLREGILDE